MNKKLYSICIVLFSLLSMPGCLSFNSPDTAKLTINLAGSPSPSPAPEPTTIGTLQIKNVSNDQVQLIWPNKAGDRKFCIFGSLVDKNFNDIGYCIEPSKIKGTVNQLSFWKDDKNYYFTFVDLSKFVSGFSTAANLKWKIEYSKNYYYEGTVKLVDSKYVIRPVVINAKAICPTDSVGQTGNDTNSNPNCKKIVNLTWNKQVFNPENDRSDMGIKPNIVSFRIYRGLNSKEETSNIFLADTQQTSWNDYNIESNKDYYYIIRPVVLYENGEERVEIVHKGEIDVSLKTEAKINVSH